MFDVVPDGLIASQFHSLLSLSPPHFLRIATNFSFLDYTSTVVYDAASPIAPEEIKDELMMTMDDAWSPSYVEPQLVANKFIELGVWFDTFVSLLLLLVISIVTDTSIRHVGQRCQSSCLQQCHFPDASRPFALH